MSENIIEHENQSIESIFKQAFRTMVDQIVVCIVKIRAARGEKVEIGDFL